MMNDLYLCPLLEVVWNCSKLMEALEWDAYLSMFVDRHLNKRQNPSNAFPKSRKRKVQASRLSCYEARGVSIKEEEEEGDQVGANIETLCSSVDRSSRSIIYTKIISFGICSTTVQSARSLKRK